MRLLSAQLPLPVEAWLPLGLAALAPLLLAAVFVPLSRRRLRGIATVLALRTVLLLAVGFATLAVVASLAVVRTGLHELHERHAADVRRLADALEHNPLGLAAGDGQLRLTLFRAKDASVGFVIAGTGGCHATCLLSVAGTDFDLDDLKSRTMAAWPSRAGDEYTISIHGRPYLLVASPLRDALGQPNSMVIAGVDAAYLGSQAARTAWLLLAISYVLLVIVGWSSWRRVSHSLATHIHAITTQLRSGKVAESHENFDVDGLELRELASSVSAYIKRTLEEKSSSDERYRRLVELSPDAVLLCTDTGIRSVNAAAITLAGASNRADLIASPINRFLEFDGAVAGKANQPGALRPATWKRLDGTVLHVEVAEIADSRGDEPIRQYVVRDVTNRTLREADLAHRAEHDSLTGLVNRARFEARLGDLLTPYTGSGGARETAVAVVFIDLDGFKPVNDTYGHAAGDAVLVAVAARLRDSTRGTDLIARLGGDEFAVLLEVRDPSELSVVANRILRALKQPVITDDGALTIGASLGIASTRPSDRPATGADDETPMTAAELVKAADAAMYTAKTRGGGRFVLAGLEDQSTAEDADIKFPAVA